VGERKIPERGRRNHAWKKGEKSDTPTKTSRRPYSFPSEKIKKPAIKVRRGEAKEKQGTQDKNTGKVGGIVKVTPKRQKDWLESEREKERPVGPCMTTEIASEETSRTRKKIQDQVFHGMWQ